MSELIKVSVIIPVYNAERFLKKCLDSVLAQTLREMEVICVDDGSTDASLQLLRGYEQKDRRVRVLTQRNRYAGCARNAGLKQARGRYVVFWDSDDYFERQALELMYRRCEALRADVCVCDAFRLDDTTGAVSREGCYLVRGQLEEIREDRDTFSRQTLPGYLFTFTNNAPWNKMYRRSFIMKQGLRFQGLPQANDLYFVMSAFYLAERICLVRRPLLTYRMGNDASLTGRASGYADCAGRALEAVYGLLEEKGETDPLVRRSFANKAWFVLLASLRQQSDAGAYRELFRRYREELLERYGLRDCPEGYIFNPERAAALRRMEESTCDQFLLDEMRAFERKSRLTEWEVKASLSFRLGNAVVSPAGRLVRRMKRLRP